MGEQAKCQNLHILCRAEFETEADLENVILKISADDHYKVSLDGEFLMEGPFPSYVWKYYYDKIEGLNVAKGKHVLAVHLYYYGTVNRVCNSVDFRCALAVELTTKQGESIPLAFQAQICQAYSGGILGYQTAFLENFDNRLYPRGWDCISYHAGESTGWETMQPAKWADYELYEMPVEQLVHKKVIPAVCEKRADGSIFIDAGKEIVGFVCVKATGTNGSQVHIYCGEELQDGDVRFDMRCGCRYEEVLTLDEGECQFDPYDYEAFRYVKLIADPQVDITEICLMERHYPMDENDCRLQTSPQTLQQVFDICRHAVEIGTQEGYLDCPSREKGQYLGDSVITARSQVWLTLYYVKDKWNMVDWPENLRDDYEFPLTRPIGPGCHNVVNVLYIGAWKVTEEIREILKMENKQYSAVLEQAYRTVFLCPNGLFADMENGTHCGLHANVYALYYGVAKNNEKDAIIKLIEKKGFSCGVMYSYFVLRALECVGAYEQVYRMLVNEGEHGWVNMIREGASSCFEVWGKDQKWNTSLCHPWASAPISVIVEVIAGICLKPQNEKGFEFHPHVPDELSEFSIRVPFRGKQLTVCKKDGKVVLTQE